MTLRSLFQLELLVPTLVAGMPRTSCWLQEPYECTAEGESWRDAYQRGTASFALAFDPGAVNHRIMEEGRWLFHQQGMINAPGCCC